ncbi:hypothetical protein CVV43_03745 [Candidatus Saccharibacteria bacterium HGW-Saccharibacteria-1]|jgi:hypothetical protein|nr:MAG: hypothetical protein CVV43_03745 [Candidatus Saccharibacteria bacterium HGW-Saccharibacteria-1]
MKKSDIAMLILIASVSVIVAFFVAKAIFGDVYSGSAKVKTIRAISSEVVEPSSEVFNKSAINPVVQVQINGTK